MATEQVPQLLSYDDYAAIDDGRRFQVLDGELIEMPSPTARHQTILLQLGRLLANYAADARTGRVFIAPLDVVLRAERPAVVVQPDLLFVARERRAIVTPANIQGAPDVVVEILSPSTARIDTVRKLALYARYGVPEVWFVPLIFDRIEVLLLDAGGGRYGKPTLVEPGEVLTSTHMPGLALPVAELFEADVDGDW